VALLETDPLDVALDPDGDILIDADGLHFVGGAEGVAQLIRIGIRLFRAEWYLNLEEGMPWFEEILGEKFNEDLTRQRLKEVILSRPGVLEILQLTIVPPGKDRALSVTCAVRTVFGNTDPIEVSLPLGGAVS
jgi:hypothetical protein